MGGRLSLWLAGPACAAAFVLTAPLALGSARATPGNAALGKQVFIAFCGKCHMMQAVGSQGTLGPNLDHDRVDFTQVVTAVREGVGGIQAEYKFAATCSPGTARCLTFNQVYDVAKFVVSDRR